jgi:hypothetical protein
MKLAVISIRKNSITPKKSLLIASFLNYYQVWAVENLCLALLSETI